MVGEPFGRFIHYLWNMKWYSPIQLPEYPISIDHQTSVFALGSCFAEHIGQRLIDLRFDAVLNPFGSVYNPASVQRCFSRLASDAPFTADDLFWHDGLWHSFLHHGRFSSPDKAAALARMNRALEEGQRQLAKATVIVVTLGTAWTYRHKASCQIVANNHKRPQQEFSRELLTVGQIEALLKAIIEPTLNRPAPPQWLLTVSPVRHLKEGAIGNNRSKAHLLAATHAVVETFDPVHYFPGYELLLDELRDYRFYAADHAHPADAAITHIWDRFGEAFFSANTWAVLQPLEEVLQAIRHRPLHPTSAAHRQFRAAQRNKIQGLAKAYPYLPLAEWLTFFTD